ncbi:hypothetical protein MLD38_022301 [Melastoma candidum]|uniref:Uncharacterized protein n=1 Tax=Melastoma candidum TaxID=119954 RepID=A0ACB9QIZ9_9MYRT|nr:hypothetical protein MLD38_022301 [Melastoma candidum]
MAILDLRSVLTVSSLLRLALIVYGDWQDNHMEVRYTDVDYLVFSDAAALMASGESPYLRTTYRYSPLLAFLLLPNSLLHPSWGKFLFSASDLLVGVLIHLILEKRGVPEKISVPCVMTWLFNPFTFTIGTRGNCEPLVCAVILWIVLCLIKGAVIQAAFWYGLIVHFRIYPIIYALPIILLLDSRLCKLGQKPTVKVWNPSQNQSVQTDTVLVKVTALGALKGLFSKERIAFGLISALVFLSLTGFSFYLYEWEFLHEALLYHIGRTDPRHNFSIYFYHIYLHMNREFSMVEKLVSFLPQFMVQLALVFCFAWDLPFCLFLQTVTFVALNKVITAQYFVWFFCLLPLILPWSNMRLKWNGLACVALWVGAQTHWLFWGYLLEFKGENVFLQLWIAGIVFLAVTTFVLVMIISRHVYTPLFQPLTWASSKSKGKCE